MPFINIYLTDEVHQALKQMAKNQHRPMYALVPTLLEEGVQQAPKLAEIDFGVESRPITPAPKPKSVKTPRKG